MPNHAFTPPPYDLDLFISRCHKRSYPKNKTLIQAHDLHDTLFYIVSGSVSVVIEDGDGREMVIAYLNAGDFFGEMGLFDPDNEHRRATVRTKTGCQTAEMSYARFSALSAEQPGLVFHICRQMAMRLTHTNCKIGDLAFLDVSGRVASTLLNLTRQPEAITHPEGMQIKIQRQELARLVGCSREMAGRVLKSLEDQDLIEVFGQTIVVFG